MFKKISKLFNFLVPILISFFGIFLTVDPDKQNIDYFKSHPVRKFLFNVFQENIISITAVILFIWIIIYITDWLYNSFFEIEKKDLIKFILNQYQSKAFNSNSSDADDYNRVTLFKYKKRHFRFKNSHWLTDKSKLGLIKRIIPKQYLVFYLRSGKHSQKTNAIFPVFDESDRSQGWAAKVWATKGAAFISGLPDVCSDSTKANIRSYANTTYSSEEIIKHYIRCKRPMPCSIAAVLLEVKGEPWGVLVLDSRNPHGLSQHSIDNYRITIASIQKLLEI